MTNEVFNGELLRARREEMGLSPDEVYAKVHIPPQYVQALESGDLRALPAPCYTTGFIRSYCRFLNVEAEPYVAAYTRLFRPEAKPYFKRSRKFCARFAYRGRGEVLTWLTVCGLIAFGWLAYTIIVQPQEEIGGSTVEAGTLEVTVPDTFELLSPTLELPTP